jgi:uncharacterized membrane protein YjfL (UPF0719 family)
MFARQAAFGFLEFALTFLLSFVLVFATYKILMRLTPHFDEEKQLRRKNAAVGLVLGSILLGEAIIVKQAVYPVMSVIQLFVFGGNKGAPSFFRMLGLSIGYVFLSGLLAVLSILLSFWLFDRLTPGIDQYDEIRAGNVAIAVFMALLILAISVLASSGVAALTRALIPFPRAGSIPLT